MALGREYEKYATQGIPIRTMAPELQTKHLENQQRYINDGLAKLGVQQKPRQPTQNQPTQKSNTMKDKYGLQ